MAGGTDSHESPALSPVELMMRYLDSLPQDFSVREEVRSPKFWKALRAELLASLLLAVFVAGAAESVGETGGKATASDAGAARLVLAYTLTAASLVQCVGNVSGAHANPAVTVGLLVCRLVSPLRAAAYVTVQLLGSLAGALILYGLTPLDGPQLAQVAAVRPGVSLTQAFGAEFLATFLVVLTTLASLDPVRQDAGCKALSIGLAYGAGALFAFQLTGAGLCPSRIFGLAVVYNSWTNHWVYWVGPTFGGILAGFTYEFVHESSAQGRWVRRSFRRRPGAPLRGHLGQRGHGQLGREASGMSSITTDCLQPSAAEDVSSISRH
ncbi:lens fiber major intrinsic protein-like [Pollicipes pollicipes]|uniref:lens fiber major intrinsic protein-like n=1 Tax=Pollicipes pollicipes TaxID=41117 RepID=UPI001884A4BC|nr:lens fiber major intrinsic protein-like [Pollicipes pollicipes]